MPDADARIAELEAKVKTLEEQMKDMADRVGGIIVYGFGYHVPAGDNLLVWEVDDGTEYIEPGEEPAPFGTWLLTDEGKRELAVAASGA